MGIDTNFISGISVSLGSWMDWFKALLIPNTLEYELQARKLKKMKEKRKERQEIEWEAMKSDPQKMKALKANKKDSNDEDEIVELKVGTEEGTQAGIVSNIDST